jgi:predicted ATPase
LPVLVQCFYAPPGSATILEQPELHLHPSVQGSLADLFIEAIQAGEDDKDRNIQLLVESHSEHFLRRLQRRIAEEVITPDKVAIYFCRPTPSGARMEPLELDVFGNITNWPDDFFGNEVGDLVEMTNAAIKRQARK